MAFSRTPINDTYSSQRIPLVQSIFKDRPTASPTSMKNVLPYKHKKGAGEQEIFVETRNAILGTKVTGSVTNEVCRGFYVWEKTAGTIYYFVVIGTSVYAATSASGPWAVVDTLSTNVTTPVRFTEFIDGSNTKSLIMVDGIQGFVYLGNAAGTEITDVDFPAPHITFPVFLNGRLYLAKKNTGDIYNSALNDPTSWTAGDFISSEVYPDDIQALLKINNYILAVGESGSEYFYDAANATASPLARQEGASLPFGTLMPNSIAYSFDSVAFVSKAADGEYCLRVIEGFKHKEVPATFLIQELASVSSVVNLRGYFFRQNGSLFYALAEDGTTNSDTTGVVNFTYVYSFDTDIWVEFTRGATTSGSTYGTNAHKTFPVYFTCPGTTTNPQTHIAGQAYNGVFVGSFLSGTSRGIDTFPVNSSGATTPWYVSSVPTDYHDFGTMNLKTMSRLGVNYVQTTETTFDPPRISWSDMAPTLNGYTNGPVALTGGYYQNYASTTTGYNYPFITQLGSFRRRWFLVESYGAVEYYHLEVDINKGQQ